jgi:hypothetical protein
LHEAHTAAVPLDRAADFLDEGRVLRVRVDEGEDDALDLLPRRLLDDAQANLADQPAEGLRAELEDRLHAGDAHVVVEELEAGRPL